MLTLLSKGVPTKLLKFFWLKIFYICHRCQRHRWSTLSCQYLRDFWKKFETVLMGYSGAGGKLIHKKTRSKKSRDTVPLRNTVTNCRRRQDNWLLDFFAGQLWPAAKRRPRNYWMLRISGTRWPIIKGDKKNWLLRFFRTAVTGCVKTTNEPTVDDLLVTSSCVSDVAPSVWLI